MSRDERRKVNRDGLSHFAIVESEGFDLHADHPVGVVNRCRRCPAEGVGMILHPDPDISDPRRVICGLCQGEANTRKWGIGPRKDGAE